MLSPDGSVTVREIGLRKQTYRARIKHEGGAKAETECFILASGREIKKLRRNQAYSGRLRSGEGDRAAPSTIIFQKTLLFFPDLM